ncbi:MAG: sigma 54-interacting transcriptional regulator [Gammaproteobacteria bacterium]|nr:sigma 54-interacting transcriptional regulator [Gammaproteobacteria bacterium]
MTEAPRVLVVDDDPGLLKLLTIRLARAGYRVDTADNGRQALAMMPQCRPQVVITDLRMQGMDGMGLFQALKAQHPLLPVIILTAHGTIPEAIEATNLGVFAYLTKPFDSEQLVNQIERATQVLGGAPGEDNEHEAEAPWRRHIITRSRSMERLLAEARRVAESEASVLIQGESGTGKELLAHAIHDMSHRAQAPFVAVNCAAIPEALLESELFGHAKGAFTGAAQATEGLFRSAHGGTLFFDEIGDMPLALQSKLLRALQEKEIRPVGASHNVAVDVRVLSATHRDLERAVAEQRFREDLYYRLNVVTLEIPDLAARREDIPLLAKHFLEAAHRDSPEAISHGFAADALEELVTAPWPGNVRQLRNVVEQCVVLGTTPLIPAALVHKALKRRPRELLPYTEARDRFERDYLLDLMQITEGNVAQAARLAQRDRSDLYKLLRRHQLDPNRFRDPAR